MIEIRNVDVMKAGRALLKNFSWRIGPGENWIIEGSNGSGKTLLLEVLSGKLHATRGEIHYDFIKGTTWDERFSERKRSITYIPAHALRLFIDGHDLFYQQRYYAFDNSRGPTVRDVLSDDFDNMTALDLPQGMSLTSLLDVEVSRLSNGQLKKLLIIKSFLQGIPRLLLLDYPFEGLDFKSRENLSSFIDYISQRHGVQVVVVSHQYRPLCINRSLTLNNFNIENIAAVHGQAPVTVHSNTKMVTSGGTYDSVEMIRIHNLNLSYGGHVIFNNFDWVVRKGERWALTGRNGAGKTTLFSLIFADHPQAYAQEIYLFGRRRGSGDSIWDIKKRINYLGPEQANFLDVSVLNLPARHYIESFISGSDNGRLQHLVHYFDVGGFIDKRINTLSSGELQLLMVFVCFLSDKELWLLDEPFQFLDPGMKSKLTAYLSTHLNNDVTLILITHNDDDLALWTDRRMQL